MQGAAELTPGLLSDLIGLVRMHTGIAMSERKSALLHGRLQPRLRELALSGYEPYLALLKAGGPEVQSFIDIVTTNDTLFFRTPAVWDWFGGAFLPDWSASHPGRTLRIWSAAAASGEEAYSLAMLCQEQQHRQPGFRYQVLGTDISSTVLAAASAGSYRGRSVERLRESHPQLLEKYFRREADAVTVVPALKTCVSFASHNLFRRLPAGQRFDLVLLRNVLIYFDEENQRQVLEQVGAHLAPGARMVLGEQESITRLGTGFKYEQQHVYSLEPGHA